MQVGVDNMNKMASTVFNEQQFENKLVTLKDSQEAINSLSSWCLQNKDHHKKIVNCWLHCLKRVKIEQRLSLFYLANDVIQYSKRKHYQFVESWGTALQKATTLVRDDKVKSRVMRIFKIWDERGVYDEAFISDLCGLLTTSVKKKTETNSDSTEFQPSVLIAKIRECKILENDTNIRFKKVKENSLQLTDADNMLSSLKDRRHGSDVVAEVDAGVKKIEAYVKALELEIGEREKLIDFLHQATLFYESQRGEAKIVSNAYRNFGNKVKSLKRKLDDLIPTLSDSPIPSPDANAPSPSPDSDFELPTNDNLKQQNNSNLSGNSELNFSFVNSTFMGNSQFSQINLQRDIFNDRNSNLSSIQNETAVRPIEVISTREQKEEVGFNITDFIKSLLPSGVSKVEESTNAVRVQHQNLEPLQPPPMPPIFSTNDAFSINWKSDWSQVESADVGASWNNEPNSQNWNISSRSRNLWVEPGTSILNADTPESPPLYEKKGVSQPIEYDDSLSTAPLLDVDHRNLQSLSEIQDIPDHRMEMSHGIDVDHRKVSKLGPKDVDHRNLISLTGSPRNETKPLLPPPAFIWPEDQDYRCKTADTDFRVSGRLIDFNDASDSNFSLISQQIPKISGGETTERKDVNVESIDMDVSEEDEDESGNLIQVEEGADFKNVESLNIPYVMRPNLQNFNASSSFMSSMASSLPDNEGVDNRLNPIFGTVLQSAEPDTLPLDDVSPSVTNQSTLHQSDIGLNQSDSKTSVLDTCDLHGVEPNGFENDRKEFFRRDIAWQGNEAPDHALLSCSSNISLRGVGFSSRMARNSPRSSRGRPQHRFPFRAHHSRADATRGRLPFRVRLQPPPPPPPPPPALPPVRGSRW